jgi:hypothetical protein
MLTRSGDRLQFLLPIKMRRMAAGPFAERHLIATGGLSFAELKQRSLIHKRASDADQDPDFSRLIREGLPKGD